MSRASVRKPPRRLRNPTGMPRSGRRDRAYTQPRPASPAGHGHRTEPHLVGDDRCGRRDLEPGLHVEGGNHDSGGHESNADPPFDRIREVACHRRDDQRDDPTRIDRAPPRLPDGCGARYEKAAWPAAVRHDRSCGELSGTSCAVRALDDADDQTQVAGGGTRPGRVATTATADLEAPSTGSTSGVALQADGQRQRGRPGRRRRIPGHPADTRSGMTDKTSPADEPASHPPRPAATVDPACSAHPRVGSASDQSANSTPIALSAWTRAPAWSRP